MMNCEYESQEDMMDKMEEEEKKNNNNNNKNKYRRTRRQQRYRAKQKLLTLNRLDTKSSDVNNTMTLDQIAPCIVKVILS